MSATQIRINILKKNQPQNIVTLYLHQINEDSLKGPLKAPVKEK